MLIIYSSLVSGQVSSIKTTHKIKYHLWVYQVLFKDSAENVFPYARIDMGNNQLLHFLSGFVTSTLNDDLYAIAG